MKEETFDVVIVGGGGAGLAAAVEAAGQARTVVLEKGERLRGTTGIAVGSITASGTRYQKRLGISDGPEGHLADYRAMAGAKADRDNPALARLLVDNVGQTVDWLGDLGVEFFGPMQEPPHQKPRMHNVLPSARSYIYHLGRAARARGADIRLGTAARELLQDGGGVTGVLAAGPDGVPVRYRARRAVVLAGGDFSNDKQFRVEHFGAAAADFAAANPNATGDCQRMAMALGASICNADLFEGPQMRFPPPPRDSRLLALPPVPLLTRPMGWAMRHLPPALIRPFALSFITTYLAPDARLFESGALMVDSGGARIAAPGSKALAEIDWTRARHAYVVLDAELYRQFCAYPYYIATAPNVAFAYADDFRRNRPDIFFEAPDLDGLASRLGMPKDALLASVEAHNEAAAAGTRKPIAKPPFIALGPVIPYVLTTHGGLRVSERLEVLDGRGEPIPGLLAAGSAGRGGLLLPGHGHSLGWAFTSGRIAGRRAAGLQAGL